MTDDAIRSLRNLVVWEVAKGIGILTGLYATVRVVIPLLVNERDDTLLAVAVLVAMITVLAVVALLSDSYVGIRRVYRKFNSAKEQDEKVTLH